MKLVFYQLLVPIITGACFGGTREALVNTVFASTENQSAILTLEGGIGGDDETIEEHSAMKFVCQYATIGGLWEARWQRNGELFAVYSANSGPTTCVHGDDRFICHEDNSGSDVTLRTMLVYAFDAASYQCVIRDLVGADIPSNIITIQVEGDMDLTANQEELKAGDPLSLTCGRTMVDDGDIASVVWTKDGAQTMAVFRPGESCDVDDEYHGRDVDCDVIAGEMKHRLELPEVEESDSGEYRCALTADVNNATSYSNAVHISVGEDGASTIPQATWLVTSLAIVMTCICK